MSTKMSIAFEPDCYHLYAERLDSRYVYLKVKGGEWVESFGSESWREQEAEKGNPLELPREMVLKIPAAVAEKLFDSDLPVWGEGGMPLREVASVPTPDADECKLTGDISMIVKGDWDKK